MAVRKPLSTSTAQSTLILVMNNPCENVGVRHSVFYIEFRVLGARECGGYCVFPRPLPQHHVNAPNLAANVLEVASKPLEGGWRACRHFIGGRGRKSQ